MKTVKTLRLFFMMLLSALFFISCDTQMKEQANRDDDTIVEEDTSLEEAEAQIEEMHFISNFDDFEVAYLNEVMEEVVISETELLYFAKKWLDIPMDIEAERVDIINNSPYHDDAIRIRIPSYAQFAVFIEKSTTNEGRYLLTNRLGSCEFNDCDNCSLKMRDGVIKCSSCEEVEESCVKRELDAVEFEGYEASHFM